ncbi:uncharacterized protein LOC131051822 [Cryptomeria japonica]|uniref:uncharacterized protein LOC131051822 n=1 Tax=Cryptomeria japonica TaxID=3369 RepID=UPI0027DA52B3|nr:uncharacterized protein LOC131051822 [Cryptomeria japonica]
MGGYFSKKPPQPQSSPPPLSLNLSHRLNLKLSLSLSLHLNLNLSPGLPINLSFVITTRNLGVTDMLKDGLARREHSVGTLSNKDTLQILFRDCIPDNAIDTDGKNVQKTIQICPGIPLVLEIVAARLRMQNYVVERFTQIFEALEPGKDVKEENLTERLVNFVYDKLETSTQEAFLDICCFFVSCSRHDVEYIVGAEEITHLEEAALFKTSDTGNVVVHDIIRAKPLNMSESSRIMDMQSWVDVVSENQIKVSRPAQKTPKFKELRFLRLGGDISGLWQVNLESLERLAVYHGPIFKDGVNFSKLPKKLRVMKATAQSEESAKSRDSMAVNVSQNSFLEELDLKELKNLQRLPEWLDHLSGLKVLILDEWDKMQELSEQVWATALKRLNLQTFDLKELPSSFGDLSSLVELKLSGCLELKELPPAQPQPPPIQPPPGQLPPPSPTSDLPQPTVENCISIFQTIENVADVDCLIDLIDKILESLLNRSKQEKTLQRSISSETYSDTLKDRAKSVWASFLESGSVFLEFVNKHIQLEKGDEVNRQALAHILQIVGKVHWVVAGLSVVAFLLEQIGQISENRSECIELLKQMVKLAGHIRKLKYDMPQEEKILNEATTLIVEGSMMCASQLKSRTLFRILKASVDSERLRSLQLKTNQLYQDLTLRVVIEIQHQQALAFSPWKPIYPDYAVGIEEQKKQVMKLLDMETEKKSTVAVVIYGFGGIGKTTLAIALIADLDLTGYNYSAVQIQEDRSRNDIKCMQQQILKDAFPVYTYGRNVTLRNSAEGRNHLTSAFQAQGNKPVFLFIDNALRAEDLKELFPKRLSGLPMGSRIVITTRNLGETDMLKDTGLARREHIVDTLPHEEARKILFGDFTPDNSGDRDDMQKILQICAGIPLVLEIVGARLRKQNYMVDRCTQIFEALERGGDIKEENLSKRLVTSVYKELEASTQEAFLDICCFFVSWSRHDVECIVGAEEVTHLEEAALFKTSVEGNVIVHDIIRAKGWSMSESNRITDMQSWLDVVSENQVSLCLCTLI